MVALYSRISGAETPLPFLTCAGWERGYRRKRNCQRTRVRGIRDACQVLAQGRLRSSIATNGIVIVLPPPSYFLGSSLTLAVALQPNREILRVFFTFNNTSTKLENLLIRLNMNGTVDTTFGSGGSVAVNFPVPTGWGASATIVLTQPNGNGNVTPPFRNESAPLTLLAAISQTAHQILRSAPRAWWK
jgi:hypothetical protein